MHTHAQFYEKHYAYVLYKTQKISRPPPHFDINRDTRAEGISRIHCCLFPVLPDQLHIIDLENVGVRPCGRVDFWANAVHPRPGHFLPPRMAGFCRLQSENVLLLEEQGCKNDAEGGSAGLCLGAFSCGSCGSCGSGSCRSRCAGKPSIDLSCSTRLIPYNTRGGHLLWTHKYYFISNCQFKS